MAPDRFGERLARITAKPGIPEGREQKEGGVERRPQDRTLAFQQLRNMQRGTPGLKEALDHWAGVVGNQGKPTSIDKQNALKGINACLTKRKYTEDELPGSYDELPADDK